MTHPFDIEEIFPGDETAVVRLPRRQAGSSPQGLAVTLLADYTVRTRAWLPSAAIVALLAEAGVSEAGARAALSRLARRGVLESGRAGRHSLYRLSDPAVADLSAGGSWIASYGIDAETWDGWWTLVAFSLPESHGGQRRALRTYLRWLGCAPLYDALWIAPRELPADAAQRLADLASGACTVFRAQHAAPAGALTRNPIDAWDLPAIAAQYGDFVRQWSEVLPRVRAGRVDGADAVRLRTEVMDAYRRFSTLDPGLPARLLPPDWPRDPARTVFTAVYDGLAGPAAEHVRAVVTAYATGPAPEISANTVRDLLLRT